MDFHNKQYMGLNVLINFNTSESKLINIYYVEKKIIKTTYRKKNTSATEIHFA